MNGVDEDGLAVVRHSHEALDAAIVEEAVADDVDERAAARRSAAREGGAAHPDQEEHQRPSGPARQPTTASNDLRTQTPRLHSNAAGTSTLMEQAVARLRHDGTPPRQRPRRAGSTHPPCPATRSSSPP